MPERAGLRQWLLHRWYEGTAPVWLRPFAALYSLLMRLRRATYRRGWLAGRHPGVPVVVVGNLVVGGTGKTPLVLWLAESLRAAGQRPGVVLRGYGGRVRAARLVTAQDQAAEVGDEAALIFRRTAVPVAVGADRAAAADLLAAAGCTIIVSDDGLQHLALRRDVTIAVVDGARGFGNGATLPAGPLRESADALDDVDLIVVQGENVRGVATRRAPLSMKLEPRELCNLATAACEPVQVLRGSSLHAVAGIGNPRRFFDLLRGLGASLIEHEFEDHHPFVPADLQFGESRRIVMTEKDAVRCAAFPDERMWYLRVDAVLPDADAARLMQVVLEGIARGVDRNA